MSDNEEIEQRTSSSNENNNNNNSDSDLDWQRDLQILMDMAKMESKMDIDCQLETKRSKQTTREENVLAPRQARPRPRPEETFRVMNFEKGPTNLLKLSNEHENANNINGDTNGLLSSHSQQSHCHSATRPCAINKTDLDQKLRILTSILSGLSGKLQVLETEEKEHEIQREALSMRLNKLEQQVQDLTLDPFSSRTESLLADIDNEEVNHPDSFRSPAGKKQSTLEENLLDVQNTGMDMVEDERKKRSKDIQSQTFYYVTPVSFLDLMEESD